MSMNRIQVIGNVGADPEMRYTPNGSPVTSFNVATNRRYTTTDGEQREETEWFRVSSWNRLAETCNQYVTRGMKVFVDGRLKSDPYVANDGQPRAGNEIIAFTVLFLDRPEGSPLDRSEGSPAEGNQTTGAPSSEQVEDLPW